MSTAAYKGVLDEIGMQLGVHAYICVHNRLLECGLQVVMKSYIFCGDSCGAGDWSSSALLPSSGGGLKDTAHDNE
eukprot:10604400-Ditylum_brightwellii.AAC.1